jgi:large subunit ribosomal protein L5
LSEQKQQAAAKPAAPKGAAAGGKPAGKPAAPKGPAQPMKKHVPKAPVASGPGNLMAQPRIAKVTVNIGVGESGEKLAKAEKVLAKLTGHKPVRTLGKELNRELGVRPGEPIGCKVTLRGPDAESFVKRALYTRKNKVYAYSFDNQGNLQFGVSDYTNFEGERYDPDIGVFGMDVAITLEKPGHRIKHRRNLSRSVPPSHRVTTKEAKAFLIKKFDIEVV